MRVTQDLHVANEITHPACLTVFKDDGHAATASELTAYIEELVKKAALADEMAQSLMERCQACVKGYRRTFETTPKNGWGFTKHYMPHKEADEVRGGGPYFLDGGFIYCAAHPAEWLAKWDLLTTSIAASKGESK